MELDCVDKILDYWGRRQRFSQFTPIETLIGELQFTKREASQALKAYSALGLGKRQYKTKKHRAGFRWAETEVRPLIGRHDRN
jgi:hypothetical protein